MKKYQVFVSSTYPDLAEERKEVYQALYELECMPVGMELSPAADEVHWRITQELIENSDYFVLLIGGSYGSITENGKSFPQLEYEYASEMGFPVLSFLHKNPIFIPVFKTDQAYERVQLLEAFKELAAQKTVSYWGSTEELGCMLSRSLLRIMKAEPRPGWVKADQSILDEANLHLFRLKEKVRKLEKRLQSSSMLDTKDLAQGEDTFEIIYVYKETITSYFKYGTISLSWNDIFSKMCSNFLDQTKEDEYHKKLDAYIKNLTNSKLGNPYFLSVIKDEFKTIVVQLKALGLIEIRKRKRATHDTTQYWKLTPEGDKLFTQLRAIKKSPLP